MLRRSCCILTGLKSVSKLMAMLFLMRIRIEEMQIEECESEYVNEELSEIVIM